MILKIFSNLEHKLEKIMLFKTNGENLKQNTYFSMTKNIFLVSECVENFLYLSSFG